MKRFAWLTDLHLNFLSQPELEAFLRALAACEADALLISGDIAESKDVVHYLERIAAAVSCKIYFVLGNHDFYFGSIRQVRAAIAKLCAHHPQLVWMNLAGSVELTNDLALVGHDGWADARLGDYERSLVMMNDYRLIEEFAGISKQQRWPRLQEFADESAAYIRQVLPQALATHQQVWLLTHVPPFREACWYQGQISNDEWLPHFSSKAMGDALLDVMRDHPQNQLTVLCGHTHGRGEARPAPNLLVLTGGAEYGAPEIQRVLEVP